MARLVRQASHAWPMSLDIRLDGEHLDHSLAPEMKPNPKYSKMDAKEPQMRELVGPWPHALFSWCSSDLQQL